MFCALSQIHHPFLKNDMCILKQIVSESKNGIEILVDQEVFRLWNKTVKCCFDQLLKNRLAYLNFNAFLNSLDNYL